MNQRWRLGLFYGVLFPLLAISILAAVAIGSTPVAWQTILRVAGVKLLPTGWVNPHSVTQADMVIVWLIRVPRVAVAAFVGMGLAAGGAVMQGFFRNPLAEAGITGAAPGAVLGAVIAFVTGWSVHSVVSLPLAAMAGA